MEDLKTIHEEPLSISADVTGPRPMLVVLTGALAGRQFPLPPGRHTIGRTQDADITLEDESVSRRHAEFSVDEMGIVSVRDLKSTNGTRINGETIASEFCRLNEGDRLHFSSTVSLKLRAQDTLEADLQQNLYNWAVHDPLTGAFNKRYFAQRVEQEMAFALRRDSPLSLAIIDIDHFKKINDSFGHSVGDQILKKMASIVSEQLRLEDVFSRFGGEEFVILMRDTPLHTAEEIANRIRQTISQMSISCHPNIRITVSIGISSSSEAHNTTSMDLFSQADRRLYIAKESGRNRVVVKDKQ